MRLSVCLLLCMLWAGAGAQPAYLLHKPYAAKYFYFDSLWLNSYFHSTNAVSDSLPKLEKWAMANKDPELSYKFRLIRYKVIITEDHSKKNETVEKLLEELLVAITKNNMSYLLADVDQALGDYYWNIRNKYGFSLEYYIAAYQIYSKFSPEEFPCKQEYLNSLGNLYYSYEDYDNAINYLKEAVNTKSFNDRWLFPMNNALGLAYLKKNKYDSSELYFWEIYNRAKARNDSAWTGISTGNIGISYYMQGRYDEAKPMLQKDIELSNATNMFKNAANSTYILAKIYCIEGKYASAEQILLRAINTAEAKSFWHDYLLASHLYMQLHYVYGGLGDYKKGHIYADSALWAKDSLTAQNNTLSLARSQEKIDFERHKLEVSKLYGQKKMQELISYCLIGSIVALCIIAILLVNKQKMKNNVLTNEKKMAEAERDIASRQLTDFTQHIQEKSLLIDQFTDEIARYKKSEENDIEDETLIKLQQSTILTDEQWEDFRSLFEKVHKGFFKRVKDKMPDLTPAEIRFIALSKLKLTPKEMAAILGISPNSIRNYRLRFRRKLGIDEDASIEDIADAI